MPVRCDTSYLSTNKLSEITLRLLLFLSLMLVICGVSIEFAGSFDASMPPQPSIEHLEENAQPLSVSVREEDSSLLLPPPQLPHTSFLALSNYPEDRAIREALLASTAQWHIDAQTGRLSYRASHALSVYLDSSTLSDVQLEATTKAFSQADGTLLTARILLGLWASRRNDPQFSLHGRVLVQVDEILAWRGVQKHHRRAYYGSRKQFSDGYPWKQKQQIQQDLVLLSRYHVRGQHVVIAAGKPQNVSIDGPYLVLDPLERQGKVVGYLIAPGNWIATYEEHHMHFFANANRQLFQLNPRNDYLALRLGFYLVEHWRRHARTGNMQEPLCMAHLLSASMIPVDKANLTSRFAPRVEAALQKLHALGLLGEPPLNLTEIDTSRAYWGRDWLASSWRLVPPHCEIPTPGGGNPHSGRWIF